MIYERLEAYYRHQIAPNRERNVFPKHILFYRDGVSESQFGMVREKELLQIVSACHRIKATQAGLNWDIPKITLLVVGKRHHARFYPMDNPNVNLPSGLIVETKVVAPKQFNFYLQSHDSALGTARSSHYVVIENGSEYSARDLQEAVSHSTHLSRTVEETRS